MDLNQIFRDQYRLHRRTFIVAEIGVNHNGRMELAQRLIEAAAGCGADAVKFQAFIPEQMIVKGTPKVHYQKSNSSEGEDQYTMLNRLRFNSSQLNQLKEYAEKMGLIFFASVFDEESASELGEMGVALFKVPSGELTNHFLIRKLAKYDKPVMISTGMASLGEIETAVRCAETAGIHRLLLLHCVSVYPAPMEDLNLSFIPALKEIFKLPVGFSDHSPGTTAAIAATALGAVMIEKHFTLDKSMEGPDHQASIEPEEFQQLVKCIRETEFALGEGRKQLSSRELEMGLFTRKSIVSVVNIGAGEIITREMLTLKRPGIGINPGLIEKIVGKQALHNIPEDTLLAWGDFDVLGDKL